MNENMLNKIENGAIGILPTDTIYGVVGSALSPKAVEKIYKLKGRNSSKPFIVLIGSISQLSLFGIKLGSKTMKILNKYWASGCSKCQSGK